MDILSLAIFVAVYLGMLLGELPRLALDRPGVALLGAIAMIATGRISPESAWKGVDVPTITLLFGLMVVSAQLRLSGFYGQIGHRLATSAVSPDRLLGLLIAVVALLSAVLANDIVCLAMTPVLVDGCRRRGLDPVPFLLALACAANVGSAATLIGNPQNMLIGQSLHLGFGPYLLLATPPVALGLAVVWWVIRRRYRDTWQVAAEVSPSLPHQAKPGPTIKGLLVLAGLVLAFCFSFWPRDVLALSAAGLLLVSRHMASRRLLSLVDGQLLILFVGLFVVNHVMARSGMLDLAMGWIASFGIDLARPEWLFGAGVLLSNLVSNVPAVMLLLPAASHPSAGPVLALASTLAGNLFVMSSLANIIVVEQAARSRVAISWREHARVGLPISLWTLALAAGWLWLRA